MKIHEQRVYSKAERKALEDWIPVYIAKYLDDVHHGAKKLRRAA